MANFWQTFLESHLNTTTDAVELEKPFFVPLSHLGILKITGDDAASFLQNLLTNDVTALTENQLQLSGLCNAKGRLLGILWLAKRAEDFFIISPSDMCESLLQRLYMYILRAQVTITDESDNFGIIGLSSKQDSTSFVLNDTQKRCFHIVKSKQSNDLAEQLLTKDYQLTTSVFWQYLDIQAGIPTVVSTSREQFTPQQVNLELVGGVSFKKGCYPGQEVVARLHYLGNPSRRMFIANSELDEHTPEPGQSIEDKEGNTLGHVVSACQYMQSTAMLVSLKLAEINQAMFINKTSLNNLQALANYDD